MITQVLFEIKKRCLKMKIEFVMATMNRQKLLSKERLEAVFKLFDKVKNNDLFGVGKIFNRMETDF